MEGLKVQSDETFAFFVQAKAALPDVKELRDTVSESIKGIIQFAPLQPCASNPRTRSRGRPR